MSAYSAIRMRLLYSASWSITRRVCYRDRERSPAIGLGQGERLQVVPGGLGDVEAVVVLVRDVPAAVRVQRDLGAGGAVREPLDEAVRGEVGPHRGAGAAVERLPAVEVVLGAGPLRALVVRHRVV